MNRVNLIPIHRRRAKARRERVRAWIILNVIYLLLLGLAGATVYGVMSSDRATASDLTKANLEIEQSAKQILVVRRELAEAQQTMASVKAVSEQPDWSVLIAVVAKSLGENVVLSRCDLSPAREDTAGVAATAIPANALPKPAGAHRFILHVTGLGRSQAAVAEFVLRLEGTELFEKVNLLHTNRETLIGSEAVGFELDCPLSNRTGATP